MAKRKARPVRRRRSDEDDDAVSRENQAHWWTLEHGPDSAAALWAWIAHQDSYRAVHALRDLIHEAIYYDRPLPGAGSYAWQDFRQMRSAPAHLNLVMSMVDTATARLTKRRSMPVISADDAGWSEKLFAKKTSRILRRKMGGRHVERISPNIIRDFCIRGDGVAKVIRVGGDVGVDRIPAFELVWDELEAQYGNVRTLAHVRPVAREILLAEFPEAHEAILQAPRFSGNAQWATYAYAYALNSSCDLVEVAESWHLPVKKDDPNGQHLIAIRGDALLRTRWRRPRFPVDRAHWSAPTRGFRGTGLVEQLAGTQAKVNDVLRDMQENLYYGSSLKVFQRRSSNVNKHHMRARHPIVVEYDDIEPHFVAPNVIPPSAMDFLRFLIQQAYDITGISQMSASAKNTLGSNASGKAIDTMDDLQSERFAHVEAGYMGFRVELGQLLVDEARSMYEEATGKVEDEWDDSERLTKKELAPWIREHEWDKVDIDEGAYHLTLEPMNYLPDSRAGKLSFVAELSKNGLIPDPTMTADLFDEPDIARMNRSVLGPKHRIDEILEGCADPDVPLIELMPDKYDNLPLLVLMAKGEMKDAQASKRAGSDDNEIIDEVVDRYQLVIDQAKQLIEESKPPQSAPSLPGVSFGTDGVADQGAAPNAMTLQPGLGGAGMPPMPQAGAMPMPEPGVAAA